MLRYRDLSEQEKKLITNGCGGKGMKIKIPQFLFKADCNHHDFYYWRGCSKKDRLKADWTFFKLMLQDAWTYNESKDDKVLLKILNFMKYIGSSLYYTGWATLYFLMVRTFGFKFFYYGDERRDMEDLEKLKNNK